MPITFTFMFSDKLSFSKIHHIC